MFNIKSTARSTNAAVGSEEAAHHEVTPPAGNVRLAHGDALVLPEAQAHVAAGQRARGSGGLPNARQQAPRAPAAQVCVALVAWPVQSCDICWSLQTRSAQLVTYNSILAAEGSLRVATSSAQPVEGSRAQTCREAGAGLGAAAGLAVAAQEADAAGGAARAKLLAEVLAGQAGALAGAGPNTFAGAVPGPGLAHVMLVALADHLRTP